MNPKKAEWSLSVTTMPNPDFGETAKPAPDTTLHADTFPSLLTKAQEFIDYHNLGGGNWFKAILARRGTPMGWMSYNLRTWDRNPWEKGHVEIFPVEA